MGRTSCSVDYSSGRRWKFGAEPVHGSPALGIPRHLGKTSSGIHDRGSVAHKERFLAGAGRRKSHPPFFRGARHSGSDFHFTSWTFHFLVYRWRHVLRTLNQGQRDSEQGSRVCWSGRIIALPRNPLMPMPMTLTAAEEFLDVPISTTLRTLVRSIVDDAAFDGKWRTLLDTWRDRESSSSRANTSCLNARLECLKDLSQAFPEARLHKDLAIVDLLFSGSGLRSVGDSLAVDPPHGETGFPRIVRREVSDRFGILYTIENQDGSRFSAEFLD